MSEPAADLLLADVPLPRRKRRPKRLRAARQPQLTIAQILAWADDHHNYTGRWPKKHSGPVRANLNESWSRIHGALRQGTRGLPGGTTLAQLLAKHRGVRNLSDLPPLTIQQILAWADEEHEHTGRWPRKNDGRANPNETWPGIASSLNAGQRGLRGGTTLAKLLAERRGVRNVGDLPRLTIKQILAWADCEREQTGHWPTCADHQVLASPQEKWCNIAAALSSGSRGLPGGSSLAKVLAERRGVRNASALPPLTERRILTWADAWHARTGQWPHTDSRQEVPEAPGERWYCIDQALRAGGHGLSGGDTLARLLARERGVRNNQDLPRLTEDQILRWCKVHHRRNGASPTIHAGAVENAPGESWYAINSALRDGGRGLPGGNTLAQLMAHRLGGSQQGVDSSADGRTDP